MNGSFWFPTVIAAIAVLILELRRLAKASAQSAALPPRESKVVEIKDDPDTPVAFGRKNAWLAVRASGPSDVAAALELTELKASNWLSGVMAAYAHPSDYVFVTPPINGWILATGVGLPDPGDPERLGEWRRLMSALSNHYDEAQYFATHRGSSYSAWSRYFAGRERRLFAHADDPIHNIGEPYPEENELMAHLPNPVAAEEDPDYWERDDLAEPDEEDVFRIAAAWSIDPSTLEAMEGLQSVGIVGRRVR